MVGHPDLVLQMGPAFLMIVESGGGVRMGSAIEVVLVTGGGDWERGREWGG